jgi:hypothetical protein
LNKADQAAITAAGGGPTIILPGDPFWPLRVKVEAGEHTPFNLQMLYRWQFGNQPPGEDAREEAPDRNEQADGVP